MALLRKLPLSVSILPLALSVGFISGIQEDQEVVNYIARYGQISVSVVDNLNKVDNYVTMSLKLTNTGSNSIAYGGWRIYYYALYGVGSRGEVLDCGLRVCPVDKGLFYLFPVKNLFAGIAPGETLSCRYHNYKWSVARSDQMPNWYVTSGSANPEVIESTKGESMSFVGPFDSAAKWKRSKDDKYNPYTTEERYFMYEVKRKLRKPVQVLPTPYNVSIEHRPSLTCNAKNGWVVVKTHEWMFESKFLADKIGLNVTETVPSARFIKYVHETREDISDLEGYELDIGSENDVITITAGNGRGAMHATQTLISLIETDSGILQKIRIKDKPRFSYRGLMVDTARNFKPVDWVLRLLDVMSAYKLNVLHLHLTDDEGWRIEVKSLPELTQVGSQRCHDAEKPCLIPNLGSGPTNTTHGSGFYTVNDYRQILKYAADRHITVIPEIDLPGHSTAAILAMSFRELRLRNENKTYSEAESYLLSDISVNQSLCQETYTRLNSINPCLNSTYRFVERVMDDLIWLHGDVMPLTLLHVGGDEVAAGAWEHSPVCQLYRNNGTLSTHALHRQFLQRVSGLAAARGLQLGVWDDGAYSDGHPYGLNSFNTPVQVYPWDNRWEAGNAKRAYQFADAGYKVVLTPATHLYFSHSYEPDPEERGVSWATRVVDTKKVFSMMPDDIYSNADVTSMGDPIDKESMCQNGQCPTTNKPENILGMQACLWSETIRTEDHVHYMLFPKLLAFAERAWHRAIWEITNDDTARDRQRHDDWSMFVHDLGTKELPRLERLGIKYRVPPPGARMEGDILRVNTQYPNHEVEVSMDGGHSWSTAKETTRLPQGHTEVLVRSRSPVHRRPSRVLKFKASVTSSAYFSTSTGHFQILISLSLSACLLCKVTDK